MVWVDGMDGLCIGASWNGVVYWVWSRVKRWGGDRRLLCNLLKSLGGVMKCANVTTIYKKAGVPPRELDG